MPRLSSRRTPGRARRALVLACLLLPVGAALTACNDAQNAGAKGYVTSDGVLTLVDAADRVDPVELSGEDLDGNPIDLADHRGKPLVVNLWWSGCAECRTEAPVLELAADELGGEAGFLGVNIRDSSPENGRSFQRRFDVTYPSLYSPDGQALLVFRADVPPSAIPSTIVLDAQGRVAAKFIGEVKSARTLIDVVRDVAAESDQTESDQSGSDRADG